MLLKMCSPFIFQCCPLLCPTCVIHTMYVVNFSHIKLFFAVIFIFRASNPVVIASPPELAGMTLETRLLSYDWEHQFDKFQQATLLGSFKPICSGAHHENLPVSFPCIQYFYLHCFVC